MTKNLEETRVKRVLKIQFILTLTVPIIVLVVWGVMSALSALIGGLISSVAAVFFAFWISGKYQAQQPGQLMLRMYGAEAMKLLLTGLMFAAVFMWFKSVDAVALFVVFLIVQIFSPIFAQRFE